MEDQKTITLKDLQTSNTIQSSAIKEVSPNEIRPTVVKEDPLEQKMNNIMGEIDAAIERKKVDIDKKREEIIEEIYEKNLESEIDKSDSDDDIEENMVTEEPVNIREENKNTSIFIDDEDLSDISDDDEDSYDENIKAIKSEIKEKIKPVTNVINLASFTISKKPVSVVNALKTAQSNKKTIDWILPATGIPVTMEALTGFEIQKLNPNTSSKNRFNTYKEIYGILHSHIIDENKPKTIEEWVKLINFFDIDHIYFTAYKASFDGANSIPYRCPHDNEIFMVDTPIDNMIKYKDDETKEKANAIFQKDTTSPNEYNIELVQVSDEYVFGLREPSIYNVIFENVILDEQFTEKYSELLSLLSYVDSIYYINREEQSLQPIELKTYPNNAVKTIKNRVVKYSQILQSLTSDQFNVFNSYISKINSRHDDIVYMLPEVSCPKCGKVIPEQVMSAETLLFTRHQLAGIANT